ncbi:hypothetical protein GCM10020367_21470 [Streptomyces sannanensis]|uniref:Uncharacterized protein n=1 Tax=Streptomyces sannanensis TaxID=285536 RepID=A0ABP6SAC7_9ACTN
MTESAQHRKSPHRDSFPLDSTAQLLTRITHQLRSQLSHVHLNGTRRPMTPTAVPSGVPSAAPALVAVAHGSRDLWDLGVDGPPVGLCASGHPFVEFFGKPRRETDPVAMVGP